MDTLQEKLYLFSPIWLQNTLVSIYGYKLNKTRYGGKYRNYYKDSLGRLKYTASEILRYQEKQYQELISLAVNHVPYYRKLFKEIGYSAGPHNEISDLHRIPVLNKETIRSCPDAFLNEQYSHKKVIKIHTTGTTGTPLVIYCDAESRQRNYAFYNRFLHLNKIRYDNKKATIGGRIVVSPLQSNPPFWRYCATQKNLLMSSYHISESTIPAYIQKLIEYKPCYIDSYPSSLYSIAKYSIKHNIDMHGITEKITTSAETLYPEQRQEIESAFGVRISDQYGAAEMCVFIGQCSEGSYHIHSDYGIVEFLREDGRTAEIGEESDIVCTGFINSVMPLIRYKIGDRGALSDRQCSCGSPFPVLQSLLGRIDDVILTPDGKRVGRLSPVLKGFPVKEVQYLQSNRDVVNVQIVKDTEFTENTEDKLIVELRKRLGYEININIQYVDNIQRGSGGKLKTIISTVGE